MTTPDPADNPIARALAEQVDELVTLADERGIHPKMIERRLRVACERMKRDGST